jgi:ATP-dependent RNA helicase RhlE
LVKKNDWTQVLVFCKTKHGANRLASQLQKDRINADAIHGNKSQNARIRALDDFKAGKVKVLVATDVAARGIYIEELPHVVNFDLPHVPEDYVHRIGRTGRAGSTGQAVSLVGAEDRPLLSAIEKLINRRIEVRPVEGFEPGHRPREERDAAPRREERTRAPKGEARGHAPKGEERSHAPNSEERGHAQKRDEPRQRRGRGAKRDESTPRHAASPAPRTSGDSGGMDFNKPYEPAPSALAAQPDEPGTPKRTTTQAIPALFRRKAA